MPQRDYSKLRGRIAEKGFTQKYVADSIGISEPTFSLKINSKALFKQCEIDKLVNLLDISVDQIGEYFFTPKV